MSLQIVEDGTAGRAGAATRIVLPDVGTLFAHRATRFGQLAANHPMGDYLRLMARIAQAQHDVAGMRIAAPVDAASLAQCRQFGMPPLLAQSHLRAGWCDDLSDLVKLLRNGAESRLAATLDALTGLGADRLEALAERILAGTTLNDDAALVPFVGAALQVHFTRQAAALQLDDVARNDVPAACPACAMRPVASVLRSDRQGLRYAHCALCATDWNIVRIQCTACGSESGVHYLSLGDGHSAIVKAETCDDCKTYLKVLNQEKGPQADPCADDLATLMLDVLVDERGYARSGPNLLFHPGSA